MFWLIVSVVLVACVTTIANGQNYRQLPCAAPYRFPEQGATAKQNKEVSGAIKAGNKAASAAIESGNPEPATTFFKEYVLPTMTSTSSSSLSTLGEQREEFIDDFLSGKTTGAARTTFLNTVIQSMQNLAVANDFHPAARMNAVYVMGLLDSRAAGRGTAAVPSAGAFTSLANIFTSEQSPEFLKVAASAGIDRHLQMAAAGNASTLGGGDISKAASQALSIVNGTAGGQDKWDEAVDYWLKKRSAKILGLLGQPGNNGEVVQALNKMLQFEKPSQLLLAYEAMTALGNIDMTTVDPAMTSQTSVGITQFLSSALESQSVRTQSLLDDLVYKNILLEDLDLTLKGNDYSEQPNTSFREAITRSNTPRQNTRAPASGRGQGGFGGEDSGDSYEDEGEYEESFEGSSGRGQASRGGNGSAAKRRPGAPKVELPVYELNRVRSLIKALAYGGKRTLAEGPRNLQAAGSDQDKAMISEVVAELNGLIEESDVGIVNLEEEEEDNFGNEFDEEEDPPGNTEQMIELCSRASSRLAEIVRANAPGADNAVPGDAAVSADQPNF